MCIYYISIWNVVEKYHEMTPISIVDTKIWKTWKFKLRPYQFTCNFLFVGPARSCKNNISLNFLRPENFVTFPAPISFYFIFSVSYAFRNLRKITNSYSKKENKRWLSLTTYAVFESLKLKNYRKRCRWCVSLQTLPKIRLSMSYRLILWKTW